MSILGCGWLGLPLAKALIDEGYHVKGSTTSVEKLEALKSAGIESYQVKLEPTGIIGEINPLLSSSILVINIPPRLRKANGINAYLQKIKLLTEHIQSNEDLRILFISSTSVYGDQGVITEHTDPLPEKTSGKYILETETYLRSLLGSRLTILRFSGLIGPNRNPGRFLAGKAGLKNGCVNLIHLDDCIGIIKQVIAQDKFGLVMNASSDYQPLKSTFYVKAAENLGLAPPTFVDAEYPTKKITNDYLKSELNYSFRFPDPIDCI